MPILFDECVKSIVTLFYDKVTRSILNFAQSLPKSDTQNPCFIMSDATQMTAILYLFCYYLQKCDIFLLRIKSYFDSDRFYC